LLTGSKNALKGVGFFLGGLLLAMLGFQLALIVMALTLFLIAMFSGILLKQAIGKAKTKPKFTEVFSKNKSLNYLSGARLCLFAARDVWFVIALPVFLMSEVKWSHEFVGAFLACWVIGYGMVQAQTPKLLSWFKVVDISGKLLCFSALLLAVLTLIIAYFVKQQINIELILIAGLLSFGCVFAVNSSLHSYLIVSMAKEDGVSTDVGFYYMANALGRLLGTLLSGYIFQLYGLVVCLMISALLAIVSAALIRKI